MIACGWCSQPTERDRCSHCGRDPVLPYLQRGIEPPVIDPNAEYRKRLSEASSELRARGQHPTAERIAEVLDVSPRTVRRWQQMTAS